MLIPHVWSRLGLCAFLYSLAVDMNDHCAVIISAFARTKVAFSKTTVMFLWRRITKTNVNIPPCNVLNPDNQIRTLSQTDSVLITVQNTTVVWCVKDQFNWGWIKNTKLQQKTGYLFFYDWLDCVGVKKIALLQVSAIYVDLYNDIYLKRPFL